MSDEYGYEYDDEEDDYLDAIEERDECERCCGEGHIELHEAPELWGEDCCSEENRLVTCPECDGYGYFSQ